MRLVIIVGLLATCTAFGTIAAQKSDFEMKYREHIKYYNKLKQPAQDYLDNIIRLRRDTNSNVGELSGADWSDPTVVKKWYSLSETITKQFKQLQEDAKNLFGPLPLDQFRGCYGLAETAALAWNFQMVLVNNAFATGRGITLDDLQSITSAENGVARTISYCQMGIDIPPENYDDSIIVDKNTPVD